MAESNIVQDLSDLANLMRIDSIQMTEAAGSGHPTTCSSAAELLAVLHFHESGMHYEPKNPQNFASDRFVLSKGHAAPILYSIWAHNGFMEKEKLLTLRRIDSNLEGHPVPVLPFVDIASGSLGQGFSVAAGMAYASKYIDKINNRYYCMMGDGETVEGSVWEAAHFASTYKLDNLTAIIDINALGQSGFTSLKHDIDVYVKRFESFGFDTIVINGHDVADCIKGFEAARKAHGSGKPFAILAKTEKGRNFGAEIEGSPNWHGKALGKLAQGAIDNLKKMIKNPDVKLTPKMPSFQAETPKDATFQLPDELDYDPKTPVAIRTGYGNALKRMADNDPTNAIFALDGDTKVSTYAGVLEKAYPNKFIEAYIAEQNEVGVAQGLVIRKKVPFVSGFGAFLTRAFDQMRMGTISYTKVNYVGSHAGVSLGEDGASQMGLEDFAMFRSLFGTAIFYPSDAVSCERAVCLAANYQGHTYIRTSRPVTEVIYPNNEKFEIGKCKVLNQSDSDKLVVISAGVTLLEARKAIKKIQADGKNVALIDLFSVKPIDKEGIAAVAQKAGGKILVIEEHFPDGGLTDAVATSLGEYGFKIFQVCVDDRPKSGKPHELLDKFNLSAEKIEAKIRSMI
mmetsp:Transcript_2500/g.2126  ORF Transcript_2500/g.2126 Transcript_2500/m.2126 type:complete len:624 (-) Transcript_2500:263-2134(-)